MTKRFLILVLSFFGLVHYQSEGQTFLSNNGTSWYYNQRDPSSGNVYYYQITIMNDTLINSIPCKKLVSSETPTCQGRSTAEYLYEDDSIVYFYDFKRSAFQTLYNFKAIPGNSWQIILMNAPSPNDTIVVTVDSTEYTPFNTFGLKTLFVSYHPNYLTGHYSSKIVYGMGDTTYMFNLRSSFSQVCDADYAHGLRCYEDSYFGNFSSGQYPSCDYHYVTAVKDPSSLEAELYPLPAKDKIMLKGINPAEISYVEICDFSGHSIQRSAPNEILLTGINPGIYLLKLQFKNDQEVFRKIIIE